MDQQQPKIPTLKDAQRPQVKVRGLGGMSLLERLKGFKKKDMAFILAGLGTLFMAPLAEHFLMSPEGADGQLQQGWGGRGGGNGGAGIFGSGGSPYESGSNGIATGGPVSGGGDIITPLNVRDPSALVMGPGATQQPPAGSVTPPTPPPSAPLPPSSGRSDADLKDALAQSAARGASAAVNKAPLPMPKVALGGSGLRGLGAVGGGSGAQTQLAAPAGVGSGAANGGGGSLGLVRTDPKYRGAAGTRGSGNPQGLEATKKAAANAGDAYSRTGNALSNLNAAANEAIPREGAGSGGSGQGGSGKDDKGPGGNGNLGSKNLGESLAYQLAKERAMKELERELEKEKLRDPELLWLQIRNDALKAIAQKAVEPLGKMAANPWCAATMDHGWGCDPGGKKITCMTPGSGAGGYGYNTYSTDDIGKDAGDKDHKYYQLGSTLYQYDGHIQIGVNCSSESGTKSNPERKSEDGATGSPAGINNGPIQQSKASRGSNNLCAQLDGIIGAYTPLANGSGADPGKEGNARQAVAYYTTQRQMAAKLLTARNIVSGGEPNGTDCGSKVPTENSIKYMQGVVSAELDNEAAAGNQGALPILRDIAKNHAAESDPAVQAARQMVARAENDLRMLDGQLSSAKTAIDAVQSFAPYPNDTENADLKKLLGNANTLAGEVRDYLDPAGPGGKGAKGEGPKRQAQLKAALAEAKETLKQGGNVDQLLKTNDALDDGKNAGFKAEAGKLVKNVADLVAPTHTELAGGNWDVFTQQAAKDVPAGTMGQDGAPLYVKNPALDQNQTANAQTPTRTDDGNMIGVAQRAILAPNGTLLKNVTGTEDTSPKGAAKQVADFSKDLQKAKDELTAATAEQRPAKEQAVKDVQDKLAKVVSETATRTQDAQPLVETMQSTHVRYADGVLAKMRENYPQVMGFRNPITIGVAAPPLTPAPAPTTTPNPTPNPTTETDPNPSDG